jgi:L-aspartate oxidase
MVDRNGMTDITNLYAIGETSHTGLHGANRMASNSLLECFVMSFAAAQDIKNRSAKVQINGTLMQWDDSRVRHPDDETLVAHNWEELRRCMWNFVGIVRNNERLKRAKRRITLLHEEIQEHYEKHRVNNDLLELRNLILVSSLIIDSALSRKESRGLHYNIDYPKILDKAENTVLTPPEAP